FLADELGEIEVSATYIPAIFLSVSAFLLYTLLSRLVSMERGRIALLKAFGFSNGRVGLHFLSFALLIVALGVVLGTALGSWFGKEMVGLYQEYFHFPALRFRLPVSVVIGALTIATIAAVAGSLGAVWRAARL